MFVFFFGVFFGGPGVFFFFFFLLNINLYPVNTNATDDPETWHIANSR